MDPIIRSAEVSSVRRLPRAGIAAPSRAPLAAGTQPVAATAPVAAAGSMAQNGHLAQLAPLAPVPSAAQGEAVQPVAAALPVEAPLPHRSAAPSADDWQALERRALALAEEEDELRRRLAAAEAIEHQLREQLAALEQRELALQEDLARRQAEAEQRGMADAEQRIEAQMASLQEQAEAHAADRADQLKPVLEALLASRANLLAGADDLLVEVVHGALCRMLGDGAAARALVAAAVHQVLHEVRDNTPLRVSVHPQDLDMLQGLVGELGDCRVQLHAHGDIGLGGCMVESARGTLDARLDVQLQQLRAALLAARAARATIAVAD